MMVKFASNTLKKMPTDQISGGMLLIKSKVELPEGTELVNGGEINSSEDQDQINKELEVNESV
jgi:hypothetical protein